MRRRKSAAGLCKNNLPSPLADVNLASLIAQPRSKSGHALDTGVSKRDTDAMNSLLRGRARFHPRPDQSLWGENMTMVQWHRERTGMATAAALNLPPPQGLIRADVEVRPPMRMATATRLQFNSNGVVSFIPVLPRSGYVG